MLQTGILGERDNSIMFNSNKAPKYFTDIHRNFCTKPFEHLENTQNFALGCNFCILHFSERLCKYELLCQNSKNTHTQVCICILLLYNYYFYLLLYNLRKKNVFRFPGHHPSQLELGKCTPWVSHLLSWATGQRKPSLKGHTERTGTDPPWPMDSPPTLRTVMVQSAPFIDPSVLRKDLKRGWIFHCLG